MAITIFFAMLGMLSPASRGALLTAAIFLYEFMGLVGGYYAGRLYKTMKGREWKKAAFLTSILYPGIIFALGFFVNFFIWGEHSSGVSISKTNQNDHNPTMISSFRPFHSLPC